jgi:predicted outer membrane repeat protein
VFEDRTVPATLSVTSALDDVSQHGTLRWAVANAGNGDTIRLTPAVGAAGITLTQGELLLTQQNLTITSASKSNQVTIRGNQQSRVFEVVSGASVAIANMTIADGNGLAAIPTISPRLHERQGGGVLVDEGAVLTLANSTVIGSEGRFGGGGIANFGALTATGCTVTENFTAFGGGAFFNDGTLEVDQCDLSHNTSFSDYYGGGAVYNSGTLTIHGGTVEYNSAATGLGGGILQYYGSITIEDCRIANNSSYFGGGVDNEDGTLTATNCDLSYNLASSGGGLHISVDSSTSLSDCRITGNSAGSSGGGVWIDGGGFVTLTRTIVSGNTAYAGGGVDLHFGSLIVDDHSEFRGNTATTAGGGLYVEATTAIVTVNNGSRITGNTAPTGGDVFIEHNSDYPDSVLYLQGASSLGYVFNGGVIYWDGTGSITHLDGNPTIPM